MENRRESLKKKDKFTINIAQESCERACITDVQNSYNTPVHQISTTRSLIKSSLTTHQLAQQQLNNQPTLKMNNICSIYLQNEEVSLT